MFKIVHNQQQLPCAQIVLELLGGRQLNSSLGVQGLGNGVQNGLSHRFVIGLIPGRLGLVDGIDVGQGHPENAIGKAASGGLQQLLPCRQRQRSFPHASWANNRQQATGGCRYQLGLDKRHFRLATNKCGQWRDQVMGGDGLADGNLLGRRKSIG